MKVFISHSFNDEKLALQLQSVLDEKGIRSYMAQQKPLYDLSVGEKIRNEIESSDFVVGIITNSGLHSYSVNQELGYAQAKGLFPITLIDKTDTRIGALTSEFEREEFTIDSFEKHCIRVRDFILLKGPRKKISKEDQKGLINNVYIKCFNYLEPIFKNSDFITSIPQNPWNEIDSYWKMKTDEETEKLFEEYGIELNKWHMMWIDFGNKFQSNSKAIAGVLEPRFKKLGILNNDGMMKFGDTELDTVGWLYNSKEVIFNKEIQDEDELYTILEKFSTKRWGESFSKGFKDWKKNNPSAYVEIFYAIPDMIEKLNVKYSYQEIDFQRNLLRGKIDFLVDALKKKLTE